ncbi:MAG: GspE/PulE family protein [Gemmatimonadaceae bacterium]
MTGDELREAAQGALAARLSPRYLEEHLVLPLRTDERGVLLVAAGRPLDPTVTDELARLFGAAVQVVEVSPNDLQAALMGAGREAGGPAGPADSGAVGMEEGVGDLRARANDAPVVQLVNSMLGDALRSRASDVHVESTRDGLRLRLRLDGVLRDVATYGRELQSGVISRIKLLAGLDIAERRLPQDGRARVRLGEREVDVRVSTLPALHGESVVLRVLDQGAGVTGVEDFGALGMHPQVEAQLATLIQRPSGLILVSGPTGSGKTTTLYSALGRRNAPGVKIITVEDPVEYQIAGVTQIPVNRKAGLGFANVLRSILRHDPDLVMVGEMRDRETAEVAVQAALTGHLVFSTLHTNDAPSGITRLIDMGIEPYLVAATVQGILAQRLVRTVCTHCAETVAWDHSALAGLRGRVRDSAITARRGRGCVECGHTGYRGRTGIYELYVPDEADRRHIATARSMEGIRRSGGAFCVMSLAESGESLVAAGVTTLEEVRRVVALDDVDAQERSALPTATREHTP